MPMDPKLPPEWGIMTDRERAAWEKAHAGPPQKPVTGVPSDVESQVEELRKRPFQYLKRQNQSTDHMN